MDPRNASIAITQAYQSAKGARAVSRRSAKRSKLVALRHNPSPIDSPVLRWTIRGMTIADQIKDPDPPSGNHHHRLTYKGC